ncbi:IDEAL domain-containing protein [Bacillus safensis]|uniref:IDEAL domain-containing protein n=1 Tax=Bacillus safensis TaxID=561879 RepID=UPI00146E9E6C|nr:IDEAL domain-containing protein [Bacillus safensis]NMW01878.1 IDEAL domain-containing protein [Bacillus safensis]
MKYKIGQSVLISSRGVVGKVVKATHHVSIERGKELNVIKYNVEVAGYRYTQEFDESLLTITYEDKELKKIQIAEVNSLIDQALDTKDETWFGELVQKRKTLEEGLVE